MGKSSTQVNFLSSDSVLYLNPPICQCSLETTSYDEIILSSHSHAPLTLRLPSSATKTINQNGIPEHLKTNGHVIHP